jgi:hypothetical protein
MGLFDFFRKRREVVGYGAIVPPAGEELDEDDVDAEAEGSAGDESGFSGGDGGGDGGGAGNGGGGG